MYSDQELDSAVAAGALSAEAADALRRHVAQLRATPAVDEEQVRLITSFSDVFVVVGCAMVLTAIALLLRTAHDGLAALGVAACSWGLAEVFARRRHMALPSIMLTLTFVGGVFVGVLLLVGRRSPEAALLLAAGAALITGYAHWRRFYVPITFAAGACAGTGVLVLLANTQIPADYRQFVSNVTAFALGALVFLIAMRWDWSDLKRTTRRSDVAFWLHLLAAPLLVHPVFNALGVLGGSASTFAYVLVLAIYVLLALVSLVIDRRALLVSALLYALVALATLLKEFGVVSFSYALTALILGGSLLMLSSYWHTSRAGLLRRLPSWLQSRVPCAGALA
jgi:hypothetical protein